MKKLVAAAAMLMIMAGCGGTKEIDLSKLENRSGVFYAAGETKEYTGKVTAKYDDGKLKFESQWKDGLQEGTQKQYYPSGKLMVEGTFKKGKADGIIKVYDETGKVILEEKWKEGVKVVEE